MLKRKKLPDDVIMQIIGWANVDMIRTYNDISEEEMLSEFFNQFVKDLEAKGE